MNPKGKKVLIITGALLVIAGVVAYLLVKRKKKELEEAKAILDATTSTSQSGSSTTQSGGSTSTNTSNMPSDVLDFQKFANSKGEKLVEDGVWGSKTSSAWSKWGAEYKGSSFKSGEMLYAKNNVANVYSYPENSSKYRLGYIVKSASSQAKFIANSGIKNFIKVNAVYLTPDGKSKKIGDVYMVSSDLTNLKP